MRAKINLTSFIIIGAAALFVGVAGKVQAIPTTFHNGRTYQAAHAFDHVNRNQSLASLTASISSMPVNGKKAGGHGNFTLRRGNHPYPILGGLTPLSPVTGQGNYPAGALNGGTAIIIPGQVLPKPLSTGTVKPAGAVGVPDGGMTATMMVGSFFGLALLKKKLKA